MDGDAGSANSAGAGQYAKTAGAGTADSKKAGAGCKSRAKNVKSFGGAGNKAAVQQEIRIRRCSKRHNMVPDPRPARRVAKKQGTANIDLTNKDRNACFVITTGVIIFTECHFDSQPISAGEQKY